MVLCIVIFEGQKSMISNVSYNVHKYQARSSGSGLQTIFFHQHHWYSLLNISANFRRTTLIDIQINTTFSCYMQPATLAILSRLFCSTLSGERHVPNTLHREFIGFLFFFACWLSTYYSTVTVVHTTR